MSFHLVLYPKKKCYFREKKKSHQPEGSDKNIHRKKITIKLNLTVKKQQFFQQNKWFLLMSSLIICIKVTDFFTVLE